jgi:hypothetical protein
MYELALLLSEPVELIFTIDKYFMSPLVCPLKDPHSEICKAMTNIHKIDYADSDEIWIAWERMVEAIKALYMVSACSTGCDRQDQITAVVKHAVVIYAAEIVAIITRKIAKYREKQATFAEFDDNEYLPELEDANEGMSCHELYSIITEEKKNRMMPFFNRLNDEINKSNVYQKNLSLSGYIPTSDMASWGSKIDVIKRTKENIDKQRKKQANTQTPAIRNSDKKSANSFKLFNFITPLIFIVFLCGLMYKKR